MRILALAILTLVPGAADAASCGGGSGLDPQSVTRSFDAGALIIPMDTCYNPDQASNSKPTNTAGACVAGPAYGAPGGATCYNKGSLANIRHPFGMLYLLVEHNIPVNVILNNQKLGLADYDFFVTPPAGSTTATSTYLLGAKADAYVYKAEPAASGVDSGTNTVYYGGMPFVIEASYAAQALQVLATFNAANKGLFADVPLHIINYPFTAPVLGTLASRPKPVLIDGKPLDTFFDESGIPDAVASGTTYIMMDGTYTFDWDSSKLGSNGVCTTGCDTLDDGATNFIDVIWSTNDKSPHAFGNLNKWNNIPTFLANGGTVLAVDSGEMWESGTGPVFGGTIFQKSKSDNKGPYCTGSVVKETSGPLSIPGPATQYPASNRFLQLGALDMEVHGNGGGADGTSTWGFTNNPTAPKMDGLSNGTGYVSVAGHPMYAGKQLPGNLIYLGSLNSWHGGATNKDGGLHIMYNTLITGTGCGTTSQSFVDTELTRSTAIATYSATSAKVAEYLGTFDWKIPKNGSAMGNSLYQPDPTVYPMMTGHFREYKAAGDFTATTSTDYKNCDDANPLSACNWDAAKKLKKYSERTIYVVTGSSGAWTMKEMKTLTATDSMLSYISGKLDTEFAGTTIGVLGGIDYGTAAVIEGLPSGLVTAASAKTRPTIAYVGGRDGMLHAFCVEPGPASTTCYGKDPGEEIWAVILPGMKKVMDTAYNGGGTMDWSKVNVGGFIRVADVKDTWNSVTGYRTILLVGMHDSGYIDALDISDPNPANLNTTGFSFLWENDGSAKSDNTTQQPMGKSWGASFALTGTINGGAVAVVTGSSCYGSGMPGCTGTTAGMGTYVMRLSDGKVVSTDTKTYTRKSLVFNAVIPNDVPAPPTSLDGDSDGFDEIILSPSLEGYVYKYTLKSGSAPTLATIDTTKNITIFDASGSKCTSSTVACQPIGAPITIVRNTKGSELGALVVTGGADWARTTAAAQTHKLYAFDPEKTSTATEYASRTLPSITPPVSSAPGAGSGVAGTAMALRSYAQMMVSGSDLYADVTSISVGSTAQLQQPAITPGTYGTVLRFANINDGTTISTEAYAIAQGSNFAGGAGATFTFTNASGGQSLFAADVTGASSTTMASAPSTSTPTSSYAVSQSAGSGARNFTVQTWFDATN